MSHYPDVDISVVIMTVLWIGAVLDTLASCVEWKLSCFSLVSYYVLDVITSRAIKFIWSQAFVYNIIPF